MSLQLLSSSFRLDHHCQGLRRFLLGFKLPGHKDSCIYFFVTFGLFSYSEENLWPSLRSWVLRSLSISLSYSSFPQSWPVSLSPMKKHPTAWCCHLHASKLDSIELFLSSYRYHEAKLFNLGFTRPDLFSAAVTVVPLGVSTICTQKFLELNHQFKLQDSTLVY